MSRYASPLPWHLRINPRRQALRNCMLAAFAVMNDGENALKLKAADRRKLKMLYERGFMEDYDETFIFKLNLAGKTWLESERPYAAACWREVRAVESPSPFDETTLFGIPRRTYEKFIKEWQDTMFKALGEIYDSTIIDRMFNKGVALGNADAETRLKLRCDDRFSMKAGPDAYGKFAIGDPIVIHEAKAVESVPIHVEIKC